jgi:hypothetical protein
MRCSARLGYCQSCAHRDARVRRSGRSRRLKVLTLLRPLAHHRGAPILQATDTPASGEVQRSSRLRASRTQRQARASVRLCVGLLWVALPAFMHPKWTLARREWPALSRSLSLSGHSSYAPSRFVIISQRALPCDRPWHTGQSATMEQKASPQTKGEANGTIRAACVLGTAVHLKDSVLWADWYPFIPGS